MVRKSVSLDGIWSRSVAGGDCFPQEVPYSAPPCGVSELNRTFDLPSDGTAGRRAYLRFNGITYSADAYLNGVLLGSMPPYCVCRFDITEIARESANELRVVVRDIGMAFGPSEGWENYGGIIRSVSLELLPELHAEDVFFRAELSEDFRSALCRVTVAAAAPAGTRVRASLVDSYGDTVAEAASVTAPAAETVSASEPASAAQSCAELSFTVGKPRLWSPDSPALYTLVTRVGDDEDSRRVGIKDFRVSGRDFVLNGEPIFLRGVCRHDLFGDKGHTLTDDDIRKDLAMIKATGANFIRLVHYPHDERVVVLADEMGLLVSDEPGLWWSDMHNKEIVDGALEVMKRVILRDRSHVSVAFWLAFNECVFTEEYLLASAAVCRSLDPTRPVSGANCMNLEMTKTLFAKCGFDFYTFHPYGPDENTLGGGAGLSVTFDGVMKALDDKPLMFTEWGGFHVEENHHLFTRYLKMLVAAGKARGGERKIAGFSYWVWADMYEYQRGEPACLEGKLYEGLVDVYRRPREGYFEFMLALASVNYSEPEPSAITVHAADVPDGAYRTIPLPRPDDRHDAQRALIAASTPVEGYTHKHARRLDHGPVPPKAVAALGKLPVDIAPEWPLVSPSGAETVIPIGTAADTIYLVAGSMPWGYPAYGKLGERLGTYSLVYDDGETTELPIENGVNIASALAAVGPSRIDVRARRGQKAIEFSYDPNWEHYAGTLIPLPCDGSRVLRELRVRYDGVGGIVIFSLTAKLS